MAVERRWTISVCRAHPYRRVVLQDGRPWCLECGDKVAKFENLKVIPASDYDRLLSGVREEIDNLDDLCRLYLKDEGSTAEELARASDRLEAVIQSCEEGGR